MDEPPARRNMGEGREELPIALQYEAPRPVGESTLGPPGVMARGLWWVSYRVGRAMGRVLVKPRQGGGRMRG